jgi:neutral trehalase
MKWITKESAFHSDFSTRWMRDPEQPDLRTIEITNIAEVDLNAFLCWNYDILFVSGDFFVHENQKNKNI